jgi:hypothetical protein
MAFQTVPMNITGPSYLSRSKPLSSQQTINWYQQLSEQGKEHYVLLPFPGLSKLGYAKGKDRGLHRMAEILYQVKGTSLFEIDRFGNHTLRGTIPGTGHSIIKDDGINMFIVSDLRVWQYSTDTNNVTEFLDPNIITSKSVDFFNNQFIYTKDKFSTVSNVGDGSTASGLNTIGEETLPDDLVRDFVFDEVIYRCGVRSIVGWYNSGTGNPPIEKLQGRVFNVGLAAINSIAETDEAFYWLGDDYSIYKAAAGVHDKISTDAISNEMQEYSDISDAIGSTFTLEGQNFYCLTFPTGGKTFVINEKLGVNGWFELSSGLGGGVYQGKSIISAYGKTIVADASNGNIYTLDLNAYTNNNEPLKRTRVTQSINGDIVGAKGKLLIMSMVKILMESGVGLISGQGDNPRIMIEYSDDGGRTWNAGAWPRVGRLGEFMLQVEWDNMGVFYDRILRITTTDPVNYSIFSATIDIGLAGK